MKTSKATKKANEEFAEVRQEAKEKSVGAHRDATTDKRAANYAVAKEKCDVLAGSAKDKCMTEAKTQHGKM